MWEREVLTAQLQIRHCLKRYSHLRIIINISWIWISPTCRLYAVSAMDQQLQLLKLYFHPDIKTGFLTQWHRFPPYPKKHILQWNQGISIWLILNVHVCSKKFIYLFATISTYKMSITIPLENTFLKWLVTVKGTVSLIFIAVKLFLQNF